jgi:hypothetical protein
MYPNNSPYPPQNQMDDLRLYLHHQSLIVYVHDLILLHLNFQGYYGKLRFVQNYFLNLTRLVQLILKLRLVLSITGGLVKTNLIHFLASALKASRS